MVPRDKTLNIQNVDLACIQDQHGTCVAEKAREKFKDKNLTFDLKQTFMTFAKHMLLETILVD